MPIDFFETQDAAKEKATRLLLFFVPAVAVTALAISFFIYLSVIFVMFMRIVLKYGIFSYYYNEYSWWQPGLFFFMWIGVV